MSKEEVLIITFKSIQDVLDLESKTKNGFQVVLRQGVACVLCRRI